MKPRGVDLVLMIALSFLLQTFVGDLNAGTQIVSITPSQLIADSAQQSIQMSINYDVSDGNGKTTGIGLRIFFDSRVIHSISFDQPFGEGLIAVDKIPVNDASDLDNDSLTDQYLGIAWIGVDGNWPSMVNLPVLLTSIILNIREDNASKDTHINITSSSKSVNHSFQSICATITFQ